MTPSPYQQAVYDAVKNTDSDICVRATAGAGKTTTAVGCCSYIPKFKRIVFLSFSNGIIDELKKRVPQGVQASTLHSLGWRMILKAYKGVEVKEDKYFIKAMNQSFPGREKDKNFYRDCFIIQSIASFMRMTLTPHNFNEVKEMCEYYTLDWTEELIKKAIELLVPEKIVRVVDFEDMLYLPVITPSLIVSKYDYVILDEAQDLNNCQSKFVDLIRSNKSRLISFGDPYQSIYSFAGSSIDSFERLEQRPNTICLTLPVTYRCGKNIALKAKEVCDIIEPHESNHEGIVRSGTPYEVSEGDLVVCRNTKPLIGLYYFLIENNIKATIVGKDIEKGLVQLANRCKSYSKEGVIQNLQKEIYDLRAELQANGIQQTEVHPRMNNLLEKIQVLVFILKKIDRAEDLVTQIHRIFAEDRKAAKLMTLHRSKGLENKRVFILECYNHERLLPSKYAVQPWEKIQERNLDFVGRTRAMEELVFINFEDGQ